MLRQKKLGNFKTNKMMYNLFWLTEERLRKYHSLETDYNSY